jgi:hypothetical protein
MRFKLWLLAFALIVLSDTAALACKVPRIKLLDNQTVTGSMFATSGRRCGIKVRSSRGTLSTAVVSNARNGTVVVSGASIAYTSRAGFVGDDEFTYARRGFNNLNQPVVRTVVVSVKVAPK